MSSPFCPKCQTIFDITQSLSEKIQQDGGVSNVDNIEKIITMILNNDKISQNDINKMITNISITQIIEHPIYEQLDFKKKNIVYNKIQFYIPHTKKNVSIDEHSGGNKTQSLIYKQSRSEQLEISDKNIAYYRCTYCNYTEYIKPGKLIYSKSSEYEIGQTSFDTTNMKYNPIIPYTRNYICPNGKCISHKKPGKKEAKFFRIGEKYNTIYICMACDESFSINLNVQIKH